MVNVREFLLERRDAAGGGSVAIPALPFCRDEFGVTRGKLKSVAEPAFAGMKRCTPLWKLKLQRNSQDSGNRNRCALRSCPSAAKHGCSLSDSASDSGCWSPGSSCDEPRRRRTAARKHTLFCLPERIVPDRSSFKHRKRHYQRPCRASDKADRPVDVPAAISSVFQILADAESGKKQGNRRVSKLGQTQDKFHPTSTVIWRRPAEVGNAALTSLTEY